MPGIEPKALHTLNTHSTTELFPHPNICLFKSEICLGLLRKQTFKQNPENNLVEGLQHILK